MTLDEIICSLEDQARDRESMVPADEPDSIFAHDAQALREAAELIREKRFAEVSNYDRVE